MAKEEPTVRSDPLVEVGMAGVIAGVVDRPFWNEDDRVLLERSSIKLPGEDGGKPIDASEVDGETDALTGVDVISLLDTASEEVPVISLEGLSLS